MKRLFTRFALLALGCVVTLALVMGFVLSTLLTSAVSAWEWENTAAFVQREIQRAGLADVFAGDPVLASTERGAQLARLLTSLPDVVRVKVWDRASNVIWSDAAELIGQRFPDNPELQRALAGEIAVEIKPLAKREQASERAVYAALAEVYVPVTDESGRVMGVVEVYKVPGRLFSTIRVGRIAIWTISLSGGLVLYLVILPLLTQVYRREIEEKTLRAHAARLAAEVEERTAELVQAQKMQAVGLLAGGIAHDFNNLLTVIAGRSRLLRAGLTRGDPRRVDAETIMETAERAGRLTRQLLAFSRKQPYEPVPLYLNSLITDAEHVLRRLLPETVELTLRLDMGLGHVKADPGQMEQVLLNLVVNARDAMPRGGRLALSTANVDVKASAPTAMSPSPGRYVMLAVSDTGIGMDAETQARIFEPFFTTKAPGQGTGLGLSTVYGIVERHGGRVTVESTLGVGTNFRVYLPRIDEAAPGRADDADALTMSASGETVLVVEDEHSVRALTVDVLRKAGYTVLEARDGTAALSLAARYPDAIHLLVCDLVMPGLMGPELAERLTAARPGTPTLFVTGYAPDERQELGPLLYKPFTPAALTRRVREALDASGSA